MEECVMPSGVNPPAPSWKLATTEVTQRARKITIGAHGGRKGLRGIDHIHVPLDTLSTVTKLTIIGRI
jgi:hypothetical protein